MLAADYRPPAGTDPVSRRPGAESVLPGGRILDPLGIQFGTGPGPFGLAISPSGRWIVTSDGGPRRFTLTVLERVGNEVKGVRILRAKRRGEQPGDSDDDDFRSVFQGLAFLSDTELFVSEGNSGRVRQINPANGKLQAIYDLNRGGYKDSYSGDLAIDRERGVLYALDQANFRVAVIDTRKKAIVANVRVGRLPFAIALSPDRQRAYVANTGMFEYRPIPGADRKTARDTGLPFPAFGFPSAEAMEGVDRETGSGALVRVPALGDPNVAEANSLAVIDVADPERPSVVTMIPTGLPHGRLSESGSGPAGVVATESAIFVSNANQDSVSVVNARTLRRESDIPLRVPGLEAYRGMLPIGLTLHAERGWLLVAQAGINAIAVVSVPTRTVLGHIPAAWFPTRVALHEDILHAANAKGYGTGPNATKFSPMDVSFQAEMRRGAVTIARLPEPTDLPALTKRVWEINGFLPQASSPEPIPKQIQHVVLIVKENRTFDEVFGDVDSDSYGRPIRSAPELARFGRRGVLKQLPGELRQRVKSKFLNVTPNHHAMADRWAISDNFYADSEVSVDGHHWIVGSYPNHWTESSLMAAYGGQKDFRLPTTAPGRLVYSGSNSSVHPEDMLEFGTLWHHLEKHGVPFRNYGEGFELAGADEGEGLKPTGARYLTNVPMPDPLYRNTARDYPSYNTNIPDQFRADQFIKDAKQIEELPRFIFIHLPNDHMARPRPADGYPFEASYVADNDYALGRIMEYLSSRPEWKSMAVFVTEDDAQGGVDHIDSHRTVLIVAGPYVRKGYVSRVNSSFPGLLKTAFRILGIPPLNLYDAAAADLSDCFTDTPDFTPYQVLPVAKEIFDPALAKEPMDPAPSPRMDDPRVLREQHRKKN
jgi:DNA-binding beta-propeller fold protein YncE